MKLKNFVPDISYTSGTLKVSIPAAAITAAAQQELRELEGRIHDTEFNLVDISDLRFSLGDGTARISGTWRIQHRERLWRRFWWDDGWTHTPWISMSGWLYQDFDLYVAGGVLVVKATSNDISSDDWYGFLVDALASYFNAGGKLRNAVNDTLQDFHGANLTHLLMQFKGEIARETGLNTSQVERIISSTSSLNARATGGSLVVSIAVPKAVLYAG